MAEDVIKAMSDSLVKYDHPQVVLKHPGHHASTRGVPNTTAAKQQAAAALESQQHTATAKGDAGGGGGGGGGAGANASGKSAAAEAAKLPNATLRNKDFYRGNFAATSPSSKSASDDVLDNILPPRTWTDGGQMWLQRVSRTPATRLDVMNLQESLDIKLEQRQARETGIDPIRRELYSQCFDELIRQITINCAEQGLLLLRIRDEMRMTLAAYQTLFESSIAFGMRKCLLSEQGKAETEEKLRDLDKERHQLEDELQEWRVKCDLLEKRHTEQRQQDERRHQEEIQNLKRTNQQLKNQLEGIINPKAVSDAVPR